MPTGIPNNVNAEQKHYFFSYIVSKYSYLYQVFRMFRHDDQADFKLGCMLTFKNSNPLWVENERLHKQHCWYVL